MQYPCFAISALCTRNHRIIFAEGCEEPEKTRQTKRERQKRLFFSISLPLDCCNGLKGAGLYGAGRPDSGSHPLLIMHLQCQSILHSCAVPNAVHCLLRRASKVSSGLHLRLTCLSAIIHNRMQYQATSSLHCMLPNQAVDQTLSEILVFKMRVS